MDVRMNFPNGVSLDGMISVQYHLGEGVVGKVAYTRNHRWIVSEDLLVCDYESNVVTECPDEWLLQFATGIKVDAVLLTQQLRKRFINQVMTTGQKITFEYHGNGYISTVTQAVVERRERSNSVERGMISTETYIVFEASNSSGIKVVSQREAASSNIFRQKEFNLESLGIDGLSAEFADIFRRAFAFRVFPPHVASKLGIKHVKGMLLFGPPETGKTLMARQIGKMFNGKEPKVVGGFKALLLLSMFMSSMLMLILSF